MAHNLFSTSQEKLRGIAETLLARDRKLALNLYTYTVTFDDDQLEQHTHPQQEQQCRRATNVR